METALECYKKTDFKTLDQKSQQEVLNALLEMYEAGKTIKEIANDFNKSSGAIHRLLKKASFIPRPACPKTKTLNIPAIEEMYISGLTMTEIATHFSVSKTVIFKILKPKSKKSPAENVLAECQPIFSTEKVLICPYCWSTSGACCPNDDYLELSGYIYKSFLDADNETRKQIIESEQKKIHESRRKQSNIIRQLGGY